MEGKHKTLITRGDMIDGENVRNQYNQMIIRVSYSWEMC